MPSAVWSTLLAISARLPLSLMTRPNSVRAVAAVVAKAVVAVVVVVEKVVAAVVAKAAKVVAADVIALNSAAGSRSMTS